LLLFIVVVAVAFVKTKESEAKIQERNLTLSERRAEIYKVSKQDEGDTSLDYYLACKHTHNTHIHATHKLYRLRTEDDDERVESLLCNCIFGADAMHSRLAFVCTPITGRE